MTLPMSAMTFSEWLRFKRQRSRVRQKDLAELLGLSPQTVSAWETGESIPKLTPLQMQILCEKLNCSLDELAQYQALAEAS